MTLVKEPLSGHQGVSCSYILNRQCNALLFFSSSSSSSSLSGGTLYLPPDWTVTTSRAQENEVQAVSTQEAAVEGGHHGGHACGGVGG